jgi:regulatory protein
MNPVPAGSAGRSLKARALQWLAQREHSRTELRRKLLLHAQRPANGGDELAAATPACVDALLDWLEAHRYLSQERFVESRIHARATRFGNLRIRQELAQHHVAPSPASEQELKDSEFTRARDVWGRKFAGPGLTASERAKQARFLTGRGFSAEVVRRVLRESAHAASDELIDTVER